MEIKLPGTEDREQQYFDNLLAKIRDIRSSERMPRQKITDLIRTAKDFDDTDPTGCLSAAVNKMSRLDDNGLLRMFNSLFLFAESMTVHKRDGSLCVQDCESWGGRFGVCQGTNLTYK